MSAEGLDAMRDAIRAESERDVPFVPGPYYEPCGDCVYFYKQEAVSRETPINRWLTLYHDLYSDQLVGVQIKQIHFVLDLVRKEIGSLPTDLKMRFVIRVLTEGKFEQLDGVANIREEVEEAKEQVGDELVPKAAYASASV